MILTLPISKPEQKFWLAPRVLIRILSFCSGKMIDMLATSDKNFSEFGEGQIRMCVYVCMCVYEKMFRVYIISR